MFYIKKNHIAKFVIRKLRYIKKNVKKIYEQSKHLHLLTLGTKKYAFATPLPCLQLKIFENFQL